MQRVDRDRISASTEACHRHAIDPKRVASFIKRCKNGAHFPPVVLFQQADGSLLLVDGLHRLAAFDQIGVKIISAVVIDDLGQALVAGIRQNIPGNGTLRSGHDAMKSLFLLATALGRKITPPEAASLGLRFDDSHEVLSPATLSLLTPLPHFPSSAAAPAKPPGKPPTKPKKKAA
ncbi:MAG: ParB N-terminal domain-containing protein [Akkermansiaceae bacterium]|nr:ParB N-terminal domain-containing protein [Akkermansiaceae bacterium]